MPFFSRSSEKKVSTLEKNSAAPEKAPEQKSAPKADDCVTKPFEFTVSFTDIHEITVKGKFYHEKIVGDNDVVFDIILCEEPRQSLKVKLKRTSQRLSDVLICDCHAEMITGTAKGFDKQWFAATTLVAGRCDSGMVLPVKNFWIKFGDLIRELRISHSLSVRISGIAMYKKESTAFQHLISSMSKTEKDVTLQVGNRTFRAHKGLLAARSPVFHAMFENNMKEKQENKVTINDMDPDLFEEVLNYIYTDTCPHIKEKAFDLLIPADRFDLHDLTLKCSEELMKNVNPVTVSKYLMNSALTNSKQLYEKCLDYLYENIQEVLATDSWKECKKIF